MNRNILYVIGVVVGIGALLLMFLGVFRDTPLPARTPAPSPQGQPAPVIPSTNPLANRKFYNDGSRQVAKVAAAYRNEGRTEEASLLDRIASQPGTVWLIGPSQQDPQANRDIAEVTRTSQEAAAQGTVPIYQLYAIPKRDACAGYSAGGFAKSADYLAWIDRIVAALKTEAVFSVEADAIAQTVQGNCLDQAEANERYKTLSNATHKLESHSKVLAVYLDAGHPEWFPDPSVLVDPLKKSGIRDARGIGVNVSNFVDTATVTQWSQKLISQIGGEKGVIIDTGRNGRGSASADVTGDARWCNPTGRGLGPLPTTNVPDSRIDAYFWGKNVGESDGACNGHQAAGVFEPGLALELARNAIN